MLDDLEENQISIGGPMVISPVIGTMVTLSRSRSLNRLQDDRSIIDARSGKKNQLN